MSDLCVIVKRWYPKGAQSVSEETVPGLWTKERADARARMLQGVSNAYGFEVRYATAEQIRDFTFHG